PLSCAGQSAATQRATTSPSGRETTPPHTGHFRGKRKDFSPPVRRDLTTLKTFGMISPLFSMFTQSPIFAPNRLISSSLCSVALGLHTVAELDHLVNRGALRAVRVDAEARPLQPVERLPVGGEGFALAAQDVVGEEVEAAARDDLRVELADRAGGGVARVGELRLVRLLALEVERREGPARQIRLAAHLHLPALSDLQAEREAADGAHVLRHVLADA